MYKYIDISTHQKNVDYLSVKNEGVQGVILRVGHTGYATKSTYKDALFEEHYAGFTKVGVPVFAVYWFSRAINEAEAINEAKLALKFMGDKPINFVFFDTEDNYYQRQSSKDALTKAAAAFCKVIQDSGRIAGIYASTSWLNSRLYMGKLQEFHTWVAQYASKCTYLGLYEMWQYSSKGKVKGIYGGVDMNHGYIAYHDIYVPSEPQPIVKKFIYLSKLVTSWRVYPLDKPARAGNEVGKLAPKRFGGLKYEILEELPNSVYVIKTQTFGKVKIWAGKGSLHTIKEG